MVIRDLSQSGPSNRGGKYVTMHDYVATPSGGHVLRVRGHQGAIAQILQTDPRYSPTTKFIDLQSLAGAGTSPTSETTTLLGLLEGVVTVPCGDAVDFAIALDWYCKIVDDAIGGHTELAELVHRGKYWYKNGSNPEKVKEFGRAIVDEMADFIGLHPLLSRIDAIAAPPGHDAGVVSFGARIAQAVARERGVEFIRCTSVQAYRAPAKSLQPEDRAAALGGQFRCPTNVSGQAVLIVDDVYGSGATAQETARALRGAGAATVASLAAVRQMKST